jgi:hypothetical protein
MDWSNTWDIEGEITPQEAYRLGKMVAAMVETSLGEVVKEALDANKEAFRKGLEEGLAQSGLDMVPLFQYLRTLPLQGTMPSVRQAIVNTGNGRLRPRRQEWAKTSTSKGAHGIVRQRITSYDDEVVAAPVALQDDSYAEPDRSLLEQSSQDISATEDEITTLG